MGRIAAMTTFLLLFGGITEAHARPVDEVPYSVVREERNATRSLASESRSRKVAAENTVFGGSVKVEFDCSSDRVCLNRIIDSTYGIVCYANANASYGPYSCTSYKH